MAMLPTRVHPAGVGVVLEVPLASTWRMRTSPVVCDGAVIAPVVVVKMCVLTVGK